MEPSTTTRFQKTSLALGVVFALAAGAMGANAGGAAANSFQTLDTDNSGSISKDEYYGYIGDLGVYGNWDLNDDGLLDEDEWNTDYDYDYAIWDLDGDGYLSDTEFYEGTFDYYDDNEDGHWDGNEWDDAGDDGFWDV